MKRLLIHLLLFAFAASVSAAPLEARIKTTASERTLSGELMERGKGFVLFRLQDVAKTVRIADKELVSIKFKLNEDENLDAVRQQFTAGAYSEAVGAYNRILPRFLPYSSLQSSLTDDFLHWMEAAYWSGGVDLTLKLATVLKVSPQGVLREEAEFYSLLARLEQGETEEIAAFMKRPEAAELIPENSAARFYIEAVLLQRRGQPLEAIRTVTRLIARHSRDANWMPRAELLCAQLYFELEMPESAQAVLADIGDFYSSEDIQKKAAALAAEQK